MVLKANDRRTSCPCHDEFRGPRSDYVRQHFLDPLAHVEERLNVQEYLSVIAHPVPPSTIMLYSTTYEYIPQDNSLRPTADIVHRWYEEHDRDFTLLS
ncbi:hypothetical protein TNCV_4818721 [Trichonephila clavipes]|nr:hypothetical protein TNCV_4818721 [Trichonephila clavipes]